MKGEEAINGKNDATEACAYCGKVGNRLEMYRAKVYRHYSQWELERPQWYCCKGCATQHQMSLEG